MANINTNSLYGLTKGAGRLRIDLAALAENYGRVTAQIGENCQAGAAVKADAYGLGAAQIVPALETQNCPYYFVATLSEAIALREVTDKVIFVLGGFVPDCMIDYLHYKIIPVLNSLHDIANWQKVAREKERTLNAIIHIDTGMNRLGLGRDELPTLLENAKELLEGINVLYFMSHFASADESDDEGLTARQYSDLMKIREAFPDTRLSLANSAGIFRAPEYHLDMVRPGMCLYGLNPMPDKPNPMKPVVSLSVPVLQLREVAVGETVGYGASHHFDGATSVATVALGYADGFLRALSNRGTLYFNGQPCPIVGRVSMDLVTIDIGGLAQKPVPGDMVEVIGSRQSADDLALCAGTIGYEILTSLGARYAREYI
jgi:alanine racemase